MTDTDDFLAHYGIKGMKWGVTRKDPSGSSGGSTRQERKATKQAAKTEAREAKGAALDKQASSLRTKEAAAKTRLDNTAKSKVVARRTLKKKIKELDEEATRAEYDAQAARDGRMSQRKKNLVIGATVAGSLLVAYGGYRMGQSGQLTSGITKGRAYLNGDPTSLFKKNDRFANRDYSAEDIMKNVVPGINPGYGKWGTNMNCRRATLTYEMRRRGYDVQATRTSNASGQTMFGIARAFGEKLTFEQGMAMLREPGAAVGRNTIDDESSDGIFKALSAQPERSRGEFGVLWSSGVPGIPGGGHSMAYEVIKGRAHIFDTQTGEEYGPGHKIFESVALAGFTRLDNQKLDEGYLSRWMR